MSISDANSQYTLTDFFKAYDVRGLEPVLNEKVYYLFGHAFKKLVLDKENLPNRVSITHDMRLSSPKFYKALYHGLKDAGVEVLSYGLASTDMMYAACMKDQNSGIAVTASHNPKEYNGIKAVKQIPTMLGQENGLFDVRDYILENLDSCQYDASNYSEALISGADELMEFFLEKNKEIGNIAKVNKTLASQNRKLKVVVDTANAIAGMFMPKIQELYPQVEFIPLYWEVDGNLPNHPADPTKPDNLKDLIRLVRETQADFGCGFDGDADRIVIVDEKGQIFNGHYMTAFFAEYFLSQVQQTKFNPAIVFPIAASGCIVDTVYKNGGVAVPTLMGHTNIKASLLKYQGIYGGEHSGHHYFADFGFMDSAVLTLAVFLNIFVQRQVPASQLSAQFMEKYFMIPETNFKLDPKITKDYILEKLKASYPGAKFNFMDGISVFLDGWKLNIRFSNTEPLLRLNVETLGVDKTSEKEMEVRDILGLGQPV